MSKEREPKNSDALGAGEKEKTEDSPKETEQEFSFLQETVKTKKKSRKKMLIQYVRMILYGVIFGIVACFSFFALKPWAENRFYQDKTKVTIPVDEDETTQTDDSNSEEQADEVQPEEDAEHYEAMLNSMYDVATEAEKSVVSIQATEKDNWAANAENMKRASGVIVGENSRELLIFADGTICQNATQWSVTFADNKDYDATLKKQDKNRNIAVFSVEKKNLSEATENAIQAASLGNSNACKQGQVVIALGNMFGYEDGLSYGVISSKSQEAIFDDSQCQVISTDISLSEEGTGILVNLNGEVLGLIRSNMWQDIDSTTANALAISDLKSVLEMLLNGESVPYLGAYGSAVTQEISEEQNIPVGVYITHVQEDSPAMTAGIQNGDVIQEIKGMTVTGTASYARAVEKCKSGETIKIRGQRRGSGGYVDVTYDVTIGSKE